MKRLVLAVVTLLVLSGTALADAYLIQVTWPSRLRASYSLDSPIVARARAGDVLQVTGRFNRWLKIDRDGQTLWLADWVDYTRLDQAPAGQDSASGQAATDIDNCCFVNRLCQREQEWVDGYWAYQRNECPASSQLQTTAPGGGGHPLVIEGSPLIIGLITDTLDQLRARSQKWYDYVISAADRIIEKEDLDAFGAARTSERTVLVAPYGWLVTTSDYEANLASNMALLVHEACHIHRYEAGFEYNGYTMIDEELACTEQENAVLRDTVAPHLQMAAGPGTAYCEDDLSNHPHCAAYRRQVAQGT